VRFRVNFGRNSEADTCLSRANSCRLPTGATARFGGAGQGTILVSHQSFGPAPVEVGTLIRERMFGMGEAPMAEGCGRQR
jgi:hypothetical protein